MRFPSNGLVLPLLVATTLFLATEARDKKRKPERLWAQRSSEVRKRGDVPSNALKKETGSAFRGKDRQRGYRLSNGNQWSTWQPYGASTSNALPQSSSLRRGKDSKDGPKVAGYTIRAEDKMNAKKRNKKLKSEKPNIVVILTDDQDSELGSLKVMKKTMRLMRDGGVTFKNSFVSTPMCCPSRSSFLTGMYVHNHNVYTNNDNCSSAMWREQHEPRNFGAYLSNAGYRTGYFGKYLNEYQGDHIPPGWREWVGLVRNSRFYNYSVNFNGEIIRHGFDYRKDYLTDLIANDSVTFLRQSKQYFPNKPIAMVLSVPAPHGPEDSAPQYQHLFQNNTDHHTPSWNQAPNPDHQWILANTGKMEPIHIAFTNMLQQKRLQTLMSVDDLVHKVYSELRTLGELDNTYIIYTSDHGYHLGQFGLLKGKAMPYEFDVRVPLMVRGPGLKRGVTIENLVANVDMAPTLLDIGGIPVPPHMDGRSFLPLLQMAKDANNIYNGKVKKKKAWRDTVLLERGKLTRKNIKTREKLEQKQQNRINKEQAMVDKCRQPQFAGPCRPGQKWECRENERGRLRLYKCRLSSLCRCGDGRFGRLPRERVSRERRLKKRQNRGSRRSKRAAGEKEDKEAQEKEANEVKENVPENDNFLKNEVDEDYGMEEEVEEDYETNEESGEEYEAKEESEDERVEVESKDYKMEAEGSGEVENALPPPKIDLTSGDVNRPRRCRVLANDTVVCDEEVYNDVSHWKQQKAQVNQIIKDYRQKLDELRDMRRHLRNKKPSRPPTTYVDLDVTTTDAPPATPPSRAAPVNPLLSYLPEKDPECVCDAPTTTTTTPEPEPEIEDYDEEDTQRIELRLKRLMKRFKETESPKLKQKIEMIENRLKKKKKRARRRMKEDELTRKCKSSRMKCFLHDNDHWKTKPVWTSPRKDPACSIKGVECHRMDNAHWKTEPKWTLGPFCFCPNSANNTYWCLRTINDTHNFLYCEFITGFMSYYDMTTDPWQLRNAIHDLHVTTVHQLHDRLDKMKKCRGAKECTHRTRGGMEVPGPTPSDGSGSDVTLEGSGEEGSGASGTLDETTNDFVPAASGQDGSPGQISSSPEFVRNIAEEGSGEVDFLTTDVERQNALVNRGFSYYKEQSDVI